jgi:hypothetical protein
MATTKKNSAPKKASVASPKTEGRRSASRDYRKSYVRLRTLLDALEYTAMSYYMDGESTAEKIYRAEEIERLVRPVLMEFSRNFAQGCPPGFFNCGGCCVPYRCPSTT